MTITYPITAGKKLEKAEKARWLRRTERSSADLLKPDAHHVLVYRVGGNYVLDTDKMTAADDRVVQATHVSLVDMRRDAPVVVRLEIPSQDAASFEVLVTFTCTVTDAIAVVRGGVNAQQALWSHLKAHNRIFELGLGFPLSQINDVRPLVSAQVKAYLTIRPPSVPGMTVEVASVEMTSPDVLAKYEHEHREKDFEIRLQEKDLANELRRRSGLQRVEHTLADGEQEHNEQFGDRQRRAVRREATVQAEHTEMLDGRTQQHRREQAAADAAHDQMLAGNRAAFARSEFALDMETIGHDPRRALMAAFADGRIDARMLSESLRSLDDQDRVAQIEQLQRERDERLQLDAADREDERYAREQREKREEREHAERLRQFEREREEARRQEQEAREERLAREQAEREDRLRKEEADREERLKKEEADREDRRRAEEIRLKKEAAEREDRRHSDEVAREERRRQEDADRLAEQQVRQRQFELLKTMTAQGHFNTSDMQGERLLAEFMNLSQPEVDSAEKPSLARTASTADEDGIEESDTDPGLREEDV